MSRIEGPRRIASKKKPTVGASSRQAGNDKQLSPIPQAGRRATSSESGAVDAALHHALEAIAIDDPAREQKVLRCFIEHSLRKGLGVVEHGGAAFQGLVEETIARMAADEDLRRDMAQAVALLMKSAPGNHRQD